MADILIMETGLIMQDQSYHLGFTPVKRTCSDTGTVVTVWNSSGKDP